MDWNTIQEELRRLATLVDGWAQSHEIPAVERDLALEKLRSLYEAVRFAESGTAHPAVGEELSGAETLPDTIDLGEVLSLDEIPDGEEPAPEIFGEPASAPDPVPTADPTVEPAAVPEPTPVEPTPTAAPVVEPAVEPVVASEPAPAAAPIVESTAGPVVESTVAPPVPPVEPVVASEPAPAAAPAAAPAVEPAVEPVVEATAASEPAAPAAPVAAPAPTPVPDAESAAVPASAPVAEPSKSQSVAPTLFGLEEETVRHRHKQRVIMSLYDPNPEVEKHPLREEAAPASEARTSDPIREEELSGPVFEEIRVETVSEPENPAIDAPEPAVELRPEPSAESVAAEPTVAEPVVANVPGGAVLGEVINHDVQTLADTIAPPRDVASELLRGEPVTDLRKAIGLNDKFLLIRDLFGGDGEAYERAIGALNGFGDLDDCMIYIAENYAWNPNSDGAKLLMDLLERKFA